MRLVLLFAFLTVICGSASADTTVVGGVARDYILDIPANAGPAPLIVGMHGTLGTSKQFRKLTGLHKIANARGAAVVYPNGINKRWNDGRVNRPGKLEHDADDVGFITALVNDLVKRGIADPSRIVFTGISNGGLMAFKMACGSSIKAYGIVPVAANIPIPLDCSKTQVRLLNIVGTDDSLVPMAGGRIHRGTVQSSTSTFDTFLASAGCHGTAATALDDREDDGMTSIMVSGTGCRTLPVAQIVVEHGGHAWPGSPGPIEFITGKPTLDFSASEMVVRFTLGQRLQ